MTAEETQQLHIPFQSPLRLLMPFVVGITLGLCCAITFAACQKQPKIIEDHSPIPLPSMAPPIALPEASPQSLFPEGGASEGDAVLPTDSIENQMNHAIQVPATPETQKMKAVLENNMHVISKPGQPAAKVKPQKPMPDEAKLHVPKQ